MKKNLLLSVLFCVTLCSVGCQLPDFSAGRLAHVFPSETTVGTDPFDADEFQPDMSSPYTSAAPRTFPQNKVAYGVAKSSPPVPPQNNAGRAHVSAYVPQAPQANLRIARPPALFQQAGYETSIQEMQPAKNRFASLKQPGQTNPFSTSGVQQASFEEPAGKPMEIQQPGVGQNPFAAKNMEHAHSHAPQAGNNPFENIQQSEEVQFPSRDKPVKGEAAETDQWRRSGEATSFSTQGINGGNSQFVPPMQR